MSPLKACAVCGRPSAAAHCIDHIETSKWKTSGHVRRTMRTIVLAQEHVCALCGKLGTPDNPLTIDHIVPRSRCGTDVVAVGFGRGAG